MSLKKQALSGIFWSSLHTFGTQIISFVVSIVLARILLPKEFGLIAMITIFIGIGNVLINGGLSYSLIRTENSDEEDFSTVFYFNLIGSIFIYWLIFIVAPLIADFFDQNLLTLIIRVYSLTFVINSFSTVQLTRLTKIMDFRTQTVVSIPAIVLGGIFGVALAYNGYGVWSLVWNNIIQSVFTSIFLWHYSKWKPMWLFNFKKFKYHFNYGVKLMLSGILDVVFVNGYSIIIGKFFLPAQVGYYNRAESFQMFPVNTISSIINKVTFPLFSSMQNDNVRLKYAYKTIMQMIILIMVPILFMMAVLAEPLFRFLFTEKWLPAVPYFQILCFNGLLYPIHAYNLQILNLKGRSDLFLKLEVIKKVLAVFVIVISFNFGIYGLVYGNVLSSVISFFINTYYSGKFIDYSAWEQIKDLFPLILIGVLIGVIIHGLDQFLVNYLFFDISRLILCGGLGMLLFGFFVYLFKMNLFNQLKYLIKNQ